MSRRVHGAYHACFVCVGCWLISPQVRAAQGMLSIIHSMKLLLLLSDETQIANRRDEELKTVQTEKEDAKKKVVTLLDELLRPSNASTT